MRHTIQAIIVDLLECHHHIKEGLKILVYDPFQGFQPLLFFHR